MDQGSSGYGGEPRKRERFGETTKFLPVLFVVSIICTLASIYVTHHIWPMMQWDQPPERRIKGRVQRAYVEFVAFCIVTFMLLVCYLRSILVHPGEIPDDQPQWQYVATDSRGQTDEDPNNLNLQETKRSGDRRHCKWCSKYKPDRCHHCRVCRTCILKMDHHCPWIYNCVGFQNHKYFFLLLLYCVLDCHLITWTMLESVQSSIKVDTPFLTMFLLLFGETLAAFMGILTTAFFGFHIWLMFKAMTTIEFCEKSLKKTGYNSSVYDRGPLGNVKEVLGDNVLLWLIPRNPPRGDGLTFVSESTRLSVDLEAMRGIKKSRRRTSRTAGGSAASRGSKRRGQGGLSSDSGAGDSGANRDRDEESGLSDHRADPPNRDY